jgi:hypothetical protein
MNAPTRPTIAVPAEVPRARGDRYLDLSLLSLPELALCVVGPVLLCSLFLMPWFGTAGQATINGHHGLVTGWATYSTLRYFLLWCGIGAFILPWMVARRHDSGWRRGEMTAIHGLTGIGLLILDGLGFPPGSPSDEVHVQAGYWVALLALAVFVWAGVRSAEQHSPTPRRPPGAHA